MQNNKVRICRVRYLRLLLLSAGMSTCTAIVGYFPAHRENWWARAR